MDAGVPSPAPFGTLLRALVDAPGTLIALSTAASGRRRRTARARVRWLRWLFKRPSDGRTLGPAPVSPLWA
jgi:hypothetical protein